MDKIRMELTNWSDSFDLSKVPSDPCMFSYWVASALPLDDTMRLEILGKPCTEQRLKCELDLMKKVALEWMNVIILLFVDVCISFGHANNKA